MTNYTVDKNAEIAVTKFMCKNLYDKLFGIDNVEISQFIKLK